MSLVVNWVKSSKQKSLDLQHSGLGKLQVVLGNTACDLDSAACTLALALFKHLRNPDGPDIILPVFNLSREEMEYKTEVCFFLEKIKLTLDDLIYRPDIEDALNTAMELHKLEVTLVDFHDDKTLKKCVVEIFDHHTVQVPIEPYVKTTILPVGSCATLIVKHMFIEVEVFKKLVFGYNGILEMCHGAILLDTVNFHALTKRFAESDKEVADMLDALLSHREDSEEFRLARHAELLAARNDVSKLTPFQQLQKDCKTVSSLPVCALTMLAQDFVCRYPDAEQALLNFLAKMGATEIVLVGINTEGGMVKRDLAFYSLPGTVLYRNPGQPETRLEDLIMDLEDPSYSLSKVTFPVNSFPGLRIFRQRNVELTRKHLIPAIKDILDRIPPPIC